MLVIAGLSGMLGLIMYYLAMLLRETTLTVREARFIVVEMQDVVAESKAALKKVNKMIDSASSVVGTVSDSIIKPIVAIGGMLKTVNEYVSKFSRGRE